MRINDKKLGSKNNKINLEGNNIYSTRKYRNGIRIEYQSANDREYTLGSKLGENVRNISVIIFFGNQIKTNIVRELAKILRYSFDNNSISF